MRLGSESEFGIMHYESETLILYIIIIRDTYIVELIDAGACLKQQPHMMCVAFLGCCEQIKAMGGICSHMSKAVA